MTSLQLEIKEVYYGLKQIRRSIRHLKVQEDGWCNKLERLLELSENQTEIIFEDEQEKHNGQSSIHSTGGSDGPSSAETV